MALLCTVAVLFMISLAKAQMLIIEGGRNGKKDLLEDGFKFCPSDFSGKGFSVECEILGAKYVKFYEGGVWKQTERFPPFFISGDYNNVVFPWLDYPKGAANITCVGSNGITYSKAGLFSCEKKASRGDDAHSNIEEYAHVQKPRSVPRKPLKSSAYTQKQFPEIPKEDVQKFANVYGLKISDNAWQAEHSRSNMVDSDGEAHRVPVVHPMAAVNKNVQKAHIVPAMVPSSDDEQRAPMSSPKVSPKDVNAKNCVSKRGIDYTGKLAAHWKHRDTSVWFREYNNSRTIDSQTFSGLRYEFRVPMQSHYAFVLDMTTMHPTEHNDVWVKCETGLTRRLRQGGKIDVMKSASGFLKVYHNANGRSMTALTVDFKGYSMSTTQALKPGETYSCVVGGRSTKTGINGIVLFPCEENTCVSSSMHWKQYLQVCHV